MSDRRRTEWAYVLAVLLPVAGLVARLSVGEAAGNRPGLILYVIPITLCAYLGGLRPGVLCTALSGLLTLYFLSGAFDPGRTLSPFEIAAWLTFVTAGVVISYLAERLHQSQEAIHRSETRLTSIFNASMDAIIALDREYTIRYINPATEKMFGILARELLGKPILSLVPQREHQRYLAILQSVAGPVAKREFTSGPATGLRADGSEFPVQAAVSRLDVEGEQQFLLELRDVSRSKAAEDALRSREALYRGLFETLDEGVILWDPSGRITACNAAGERILGYRIEEIVGMHYSQIPWQPRGPDDRDFDPEKLAVAIIHRTGKPLREAEQRFTRRDGARVWIQQTGVPLRLQDNDGPPHVIVAFSDITERRQHLMTISRMANIVAHSNDAIISNDQDGLILTWNPGAQQLFGYTAEEAIGKPFSQLLIAPGNETSEWQLRQRVLHGEQVAPFEFTLLCKDKQPVEVSITVSPMRDAGEGIAGVSVIARDVTARRRMEEAIRDRDAAEEASRLKSEFLATMSHELRTPLTGVIGFAEYLAAGQAGPLNEEQAESIDTIHRSSLHLLDLIDGLLDLSRIEAGKMELLPETFAVREVVDEVCDGLQPMADKKRLQMNRAVADGVARVMLDRPKFKQVLYNLLSNAVKFTDDGGRISVDVSMYKAGQLALSVSDSGIGIAAQDVDKLFQKFYQLDNRNSRRHEGVGLGLALTKKMVELQRGMITVESAPGEGSVFTVILPYAPAADG